LNKLLWKPSKPPNDTCQTANYFSEAIKKSKNISFDVKVMVGACAMEENDIMTHVTLRMIFSG